MFLWLRRLGRRRTKMKGFFSPKIKSFQMCLQSTIPALQRSEIKRAQDVPAPRSCSPRRTRPLRMTEPACAPLPPRCPQWRFRTARALVGVCCDCERDLLANLSGDLEWQAHICVCKEQQNVNGTCRQKSGRDKMQFSVALEPWHQCSRSGRNLVYASYKPALPTVLI